VFVGLARRFCSWRAVPIGYERRQGVYLMPNEGVNLTTPYGVAGYTRRVRPPETAATERRGGIDTLQGARESLKWEEPLCYYEVGLLSERAY
jgi:hypothetical protein